MPLQRHVPERTCVGCRSNRPKREMVRVVRGADGKVAVDPSGKRSGRGAYVCREPRCWQNALRQHALERALKAELAADDRARLEDFVRLHTGATAASGEVEEHDES